MGDEKAFAYYLGKILDDLKFVNLRMKGISYSDFAKNDLLNRLVCFKFVQVSENAKKIPEEALVAYPDIPWKQINGL